MTGFSASTYGAIAADVPARVRPSQVGICVQRGRVFNAAFSTQTTYEMVMAVAATKVTAVRVIFAAGQTGGSSAVAVNLTGGVRAVPDVSDAAAQAATHKSLRFSAVATGSFAPAASSSRANLIFSDWVPIRSVARTDGGSGSLFAIRCNLASGQVVISGDNTDSFAAWENQPDGRIIRRRHITFAADYSSSALWASWASAAGNVSKGCPIVGLQYVADGKVINMFGFGDSITEGRATRIGEGFGLPSAVALSANAGNVAVEWSNFAWSGQTMPQIKQHVVDVLAAGLIPDIAVIPSGSPNNIGNRAIVQTDIDGAAGGPDNCLIQTRSEIHVALLGAARHITPIWWTWMPTNTAVNNYGASDSIRRADNDSVRGWASHGAVVADFDATMAGATSGGQVQMVVGYNNDGIHPNDSGNVALATVLTKAGRKATGLVMLGYLAT